MISGFESGVRTTFKILRIYPEYTFVGETKLGLGVYLTSRRLYFENTE